MSYKNILPEQARPADELMALFNSIKDVPSSLFDSDNMRLPTRTLGEFDNVPKSTFSLVRSYCPELKHFVDEVSYATSKFFYGQHTDDEWDRHYVFPSTSTLMELTDKQEADLFVVNGSKQDTHAWLSSFIDDVNPISQSKARQNNIMIMLGGIGSGKSTYIKYVTSRFFKLMKDKKVAPSRIECKKLKQRIENKQSSITDKEAFARYLRYAAVRDLLLFCHFSRQSGYYVSESKNTFSDHERESFIKFLRSNFQSQYGTRSIRQTFCKEIAQIIERYDWRKMRAFLHDLSDDELDVIIEYYYLKGWIVTYIYDGFDYLSPFDLVGTNSSSHLLEMVSRFVWLERTVPQHSFSRRHEAASIILLRNNTYAWFAKYYRDLYKHDRITRAVVVAPSIDDVMSRAIHRIGNAVGYRKDDVKELEAISARMLNAMAIEMRGAKPLNVADLFNHNVRYQLRYLHDIIAELTNDAIRALAPEQRQKINHHDLLTVMRQAADTMLQHKTYRLVDILLCGQNRVFYNSIEPNSAVLSVMDLKSAVQNKEEGLFIERNIESGIVDNMYNYHVQGKWSLHKQALLEKLRILHILNKTSGHTAASLKNELIARFAYCSKSYDVTLAILTVVGAVSCEWRNFEAYYRLEPMGFVLRERLCVQLAYVEHTFHCTLLPATICQSAVDATRPKGVEEWAFASIINAYLFLVTVRSIENESKELLELSDDDCVYQELFDSISLSIRRMIDSGARVSLAARATRKIYDLQKILR